MKITYLISTVLSASDEETYMTWADRMKKCFINYDLLKIVEATTKPPKPEDGEIAIKDWSQKNALALFLIRESCGSNTLPLIGNISEAKKAWDTLAFCQRQVEDFSGSCLHSLENKHAHRSNILN